MGIRRPPDRSSASPSPPNAWLLAPLRSRLHQLALGMAGTPPRTRASRASAKGPLPETGPTIRRHPSARRVEQLSRRAEASPTPPWSRCTHRQHGPEAGHFELLGEAARRLSLPPYTQGKLRSKRCPYPPHAGEDARRARWGAPAWHFSSSGGEGPPHAQRSNPPCAGLPQRPHPLLGLQPTGAPVRQARPRRQPPAAAAAADVADLVNAVPSSPPCRQRSWPSPRDGAAGSRCCQRTGAFPASDSHRRTSTPSWIALRALADDVNATPQRTGRETPHASRRSATLTAATAIPRRLRTPGSPSSMDAHGQPQPTHPFSPRRRGEATASHSEAG
jgi:hypothetical protein